MVDQTYDIQELVQSSGVPRRTVYFYVQQGILPPPEGAGLAARYNEDHLLRLRLIPVLRAQGLRLDDIRERFGHMDAVQMRSALDQAQSTPQPPAGRLPYEPPGIPPGWGESHFTHYLLPAGISLVAPDKLSPLDRQRLNLLLQAARQIFSGNGGVAPAITNPPVMHSGEDGEGQPSKED